MRKTEDADLSGFAKFKKDLQYAVERGEKETVEALLSQTNPREVKRALSQRMDANDQWTLLMKAAGAGQSEICELLINAGANVNDNVNSYTALMAATTTNDEQSAVAVARILLAAGANPKVGDRFRETVLMKAAAKGFKEMVDLLLKNKADVNERDNTKRSALYYATYGGHTDTVKRLLEAKPDDHAIREAVALAEYRELPEITSILVGPDEKPDKEVVPFVTTPKYVFQEKVLPELPTGDGRVGFRSDVPDLLSGVGQRFYSSSLLNAGFGIAQVIFAGDEDLRKGGVRLAPQRRAIMEGMIRFALHEWKDGTLPAVTTMLSAVHAACSAVRQIHVMWATSVLARLRFDPNVEGEADVSGRMTADALTTTRKAILCAKKLQERARTLGALAASKVLTDPAPPADLIHPCGG